MNMQRTALAAALVSITLGTAGCDEGVGPGQANEVGLSFEVASPSAGLRTSLAVNSAAAASATLTLDSAQVVLARVRLHREDEKVSCESERKGCQWFASGPVLVNLPLKGGKITPFAIRPAAGVYDRLEFKIHRPEGNDSVTQAFRAKYPSWPSTAAIRVMGKYDGQPFDLFFRTEAEIRQEFEPPLVINDTTNLASVGLTVSVDVATWFAGEAGPVDPRALTSSPRLLSQVERNIRESFKARHARGKSDSPGGTSGTGRDKDD